MTGRNGTAVGQSVVEFALAMPVALLVILGVFDFGRAVLAYNALAGAAREGTRYAIVHGSTSASPAGPGAPTYSPSHGDSVVTARVLAFTVAMDPHRVRVLSEWPAGGNNPGQPVRVEVRYHFIPLFGPLLGGRSLWISSVSEATIVN